MDTKNNNSNHAKAKSALRLNETKTPNDATQQRIKLRGAERNSIAMKLNRGHCIHSIDIFDSVNGITLHRTSNYAIKSKSTGKICLENIQKEPSIEHNKRAYSKHRTNL